MKSVGVGGIKHENIGFINWLCDRPTCFHSFVSLDKVMKELKEIKAELNKTSSMIGDVEKVIKSEVATMIQRGV